MLQGAPTPLVLRGRGSLDEPAGLKLSDGLLNGLVVVANIQLNQPATRHALRVRVQRGREGRILERFRGDLCWL